MKALQPARVVETYSAGIKLARCRNRQRDLWQGAQPASERLAKKKVSFIGMWSARKGANDWRKIIRRVRAAVPDARPSGLFALVNDVVADLDAVATASARWPAPLRSAVERLREAWIQATPHS